jgi:hypothetical protein
LAGHLMFKLPLRQFSATIRTRPDKELKSTIGSRAGDAHVVEHVGAGDAPHPRPDGGADRGDS